MVLARLISAIIVVYTPAWTVLTISSGFIAGATYYVFNSLMNNWFNARFDSISMHL